MSDAAAQSDQFFATLGRTITTWQGVEIALYFIFEAATLPKIPTAAGAAFQGFKTADPKLEAASNALQVALGDNAELRDQWKKLKRRVKEDGIEVRNKLAHCMSLEYTGEELPAGQERVTMQPPIYDVKRYNADTLASATFTLKRLKEIQEEWFTLMTDLLAFHKLVHAQVERMVAARGKG